MVESTLMCERTWVQVLCMPFMCYLICYYFYIMPESCESQYYYIMVLIITKYEMVAWLCNCLTLAWYEFEPW